MYGIWDENGFVSATDRLGFETQVFSTQYRPATLTAPALDVPVTIRRFMRYSYRLPNGRTVHAYTNNYSHTFYRLMSTAQAIAAAFAPPGWHPSCPRFSPTPIPEDGTPLFGINGPAGPLSTFRFSPRAEVGRADYVRRLQELYVRRLQELARSLWGPPDTLRRDEDD